MIHPAMFVFGAKLIGSLLAKSSWGGLFGGPPPIDWMLYAVPLRNMADFMDEHPDAIPPETFAQQLKEAGYGSYSGSITDQAREFQRKHPECIIVCADFKRT